MALPGALDPCPLTMRKTAHPSHSGCNHWLPRFPLTSRSEIRCPPLSFGHSACLEDCGSIWNSHELLHLLIFSLHGLEWLSHLGSGFWEWYAPELQGGEAMVAQICRVLVGSLLECRVHRWYYELGTFWKHRAYLKKVGHWQWSLEASYSWLLPFSHSASWRTMVLSFPSIKDAKSWDDPSETRSWITYFFCRAVRIWYLGLSNGKVAKWMNLYGTPQGSRGCVCLPWIISGKPVLG